MISTDVSISAERAVADRLISSLRPYIKHVAAAVRNGVALADALESAGRQQSNLSQYFLTGSDPFTFGLRPELIFPDNDPPQDFIFFNKKSGRKMELTGLVEEEIREIGNVIWLLSQNDFASPHRALKRALDDLQVFTERLPEAGWKTVAGSGIVRLQHASFLLQTQKAKVLVDPHFVSPYSVHLQPESQMRPSHFGSINAVLITHSHADHYHIPSLMMLPRDTLIIVPKIQKPSILSPAMRQELCSIGFSNVIEQDWYSAPVRVEDIDIMALPFFGEQPLRYERPRDNKLRNWGNSYLFRTPDYSAWCLIDSGADSEGSMLDVACVVKQQFGMVDVVLSNLQRFHVGVGRGNPFYVSGRGHYWLALTADQVVRLPEMATDLITLGTEGVAEICAVVGAKYFLPYSHLWSEFATHPSNEKGMLESLREEPVFTRAGTKTVEWRIGDVWPPGC